MVEIKHRKRTRRVRHRQITAHDREVYRQNALNGTEIWKETPEDKRLGKRMRPSHGWGFQGQSPHTRPRRYKHKKNRGE